MAPEIGDIEILNLLGQGGMSQVYRARQMTLDRIVALKVLSKLTVQDEADSKRFLKEAQLTGSLDHPNIVKILSSGVSKDGEPYLLMEFVEGRTLAQELETNGRLSMQKFRDIFLPLLSALEEAHKCGLVHRDIKPGNIMLCKTAGGIDTVKLLDFGIAKILSDGNSAAQNLTKTGVLLGSPNYMSPEQCQGAIVDHRSDIYSLACVMYESLCGQLPFTGETALEVMNKHASQAPPTVPELNRKIEIEKGLAALVISGLSKNPAERPQNAAEFAARLREVLAESTMDKVPRLKEKAREPDGRRVPIMAIAATGLCLLIFVWGLVTNNSRSSSRQKPLSDDSAADHHHAEGLIVVGKKLVEAGNDKEALKNFEKAIELLHEDPHHKDAMCRAYTGAAGSLSRIMILQGLFSDEKDSFGLGAKLEKYCDKSVSAGFESGDYNLGSIACVQKIVLMRNPEQRSGEIIELVHKFDRAWHKDSPQALALRDTALHTLILNGCTTVAEPLLLETLKQSKRKYGEHSYETLQAQATHVLFLAKKGQFHQCNELAATVGMEIIESTGISLEPAKRGPMLSEHIFNALLITKDIDLMRKLAEQEDRINRDLYTSCKQSGYLGSIYSRLAHAYETDGQWRKAIDAFEKAETLYANDRKRKTYEKTCLADLLNLCREHAQVAEMAKYKEKLAILSKDE